MLFQLSVFREIYFITPKLNSTFKYFLLIKGRIVFSYDVATLVERGVHNIVFAHEKDPGEI